MRFFGNIRDYIHWTASVGILLTYFFVSTSVDLFHNESYEQSRTGEPSTNAIPDNGQCPACTFKAGSNCTQPPCKPNLVALEVDIQSQPILHSVHIPSVQWMSSIVLRGPPSTIIS